MDLIADDAKSRKANSTVTSNSPGPEVSVEVDLSIIIPCLNEEENVQGAISTAAAAAQAVGCRYEILVIDDGSTDLTFKRASEFSEEHPEIPVKVHKNPTNRGLAACFLEGAFTSRGRYYRLCCGDNVESVDTLRKIFASMGKADIIAPYQPFVQGRSTSRRILSTTYTRLINLLSGHHLKYYNGCALLLRKDVLKWHSYSNGFGFQADMITRMLDAGATVMEFPVDVVDRRAGASKALTIRNLASTGHVLFEICLRRLRKTVFGK